MKRIVKQKMFHVKQCKNKSVSRYEESAKQKMFHVKHCKNKSVSRYEESVKQKNVSHETMQK